MLKKITLLLFIVFSLFSCTGDKNNDGNTVEQDSNTEVSVGDNSDDELGDEEEDDFNDDDIDYGDEEEDNSVGFDCDKAYEEVTEGRKINEKEFGKDYSSCLFEVGDTGCAGIDDSKKTINYQIILDYSNSMNLKIGDETRMSIAKQAFSKFIAKVDKNTKVGLIAYGHKEYKNGIDACTHIEQLEEIGLNNRDSLVKKMDTYKARGFTPIAKSLKMAGETFQNMKGDDNENHILLISDGIESCQGNPLEEVKKLVKDKIVVSIIGFDVNDKSSKQLQAITNISGGQYFRASGLDELEKHLEDFDTYHTCYMNKAMNSLDESLKLMGDSFECLHSLDMEKSMELTNIATYFDAPQICKNEMKEKVLKRHNLIKTKIEENKKEAEKDIDKLNKGIEDAADDLDDWSDDTIDESNDLFDGGDIDIDDVIEDAKSGAGIDLDGFDMDGF